jgi:LemA protein
MEILIAIAVVAVVIILWCIAMYNGLVSDKQKLEEGASGIDVQLKRRNDLIPNLLEAVKGYMSHEKDLLAKVTELRTQSQSLAGKTIADRASTESQLSGALANVFAVAENYPDLKANTNFIELQRSLNEIEDQLQLARRYYNGTARNYNTRVQSFPGNIVAAKFNFKTTNYFEIEEGEKAVPQVKF